MILSTWKRALTALAVQLVVISTAIGGPSVGVGNPGLRVFKSDKGFTLKVPKELEVRKLGPNKYWIDNQRLLKPKDRKSTLEIEILKPQSKKDADRAPDDEFRRLRDFTYRSHPKLYWNELKFPGALVMAHEERSSDHVYGLYYLQTYSKLLIRARVLAYSDAQGLSLIAPIIRSFGFDLEAPRIHALRADPKVEAGGKGRLYIQATDDLAGLVLSFTHDPRNYSYCARFAAAHYRNQYFRACGELRPEPELGEDWYSVEFSPGPYLPADTYFLDRIQIRDQAGKKYNMGLMIRDPQSKYFNGWHESALTYQQDLLPASRLLVPNSSAQGSLVSCDLHAEERYSAESEQVFWAREQRGRSPLPPVSVELVRGGQLPEADITPPRLISMTPLEAPWTTGREAQLELRIEDAGSGVIEACILLESASGWRTKTQDVCAQLEPQAENRFLLRFPLGKHLATDQYMAGSIILRDRAGNQAYLRASIANPNPWRYFAVEQRSFPMGKATEAVVERLQINNPEAVVDQTAPLVRSFYLGNPLRQGEKATLFFRASDDLAGISDPSGLSKVCARLDSVRTYHAIDGESGRSNLHIYFCDKPVLQSGSRTDGIFKVSFQVPSHVPTGQYVLKDFRLWDDFGNEQYLVPETHKSSDDRYFNKDDLQDITHYFNSNASRLDRSKPIKVLVTDLF